MPNFIINEQFWGNRDLEAGEIGHLGPDGFFVDYDSIQPAIVIRTDSLLNIQGAISTDETAVQIIQGGNVFISAGGGILAGYSGIRADSGGGIRIANAGLIQSFDAAVSLDGGVNSGSATITNSGEISSMASAGIVTAKLSSSFITNHGLIQGAITGIEIFDDQTVQITNTGTILGGQFAIFIGGSQSAFIFNRGDIDGGVLLGSGADQFHGRGGYQSLVNGRAGNDRIVGGSADEDLYGDFGNDTLVGNGGDDRLDGGVGADTLTGGGGEDLLTGGTGSDVFVFRRGHGDDVIVDFADGRDRIDVSAFRFANAAAVTALAVNRPGGLLIDLTDHGGGTIFIDGLSAAAFTAADMILA